AKRVAEIEKLKAEMKPIEDAAIKKMPPEDQLAVDNGKRDQIVKTVPQYLEPPGKAQYASLRKQLEDLRRKPQPNRELTIAVNNCNVSPPPVFVLARGNPHAAKEKELFPPGFPAVLGLPDPVIPPPAKGAKTSGRRTALANWIASKENPLTARV